MTKTFRDCDAVVKVYEGGNVDDPRDPGGRTSRGVTQNRYNTYRRVKGLPLQDVYKMDEAERLDIYMTGYWLPIQGDKLRDGVNLCIYDPSVNSGPGRAIIWAQQALGFASKDQDGQMGTKTLNALTALNDDDAFIEKYNAIRLGTLERLKTWKEFGHGWHARIANGQKIEEAWAAGSNHPDPVDVSSKGGHTRAAVADDQMKAPILTAARAHVITGVGAATAASATYAPQLTGLTDTFSWAKYAAGGLILVGIGAGIIKTMLGDASDDALGGLRLGKVDMTADTDPSTFPPVPVPLPSPAAAPAVPA